MWPCLSHTNPEPEPWGTSSTSNVKASCLIQTPRNQITLDNSSNYREKKKNTCKSSEIDRNVSSTIKSNSPIKRREIKFLPHSEISDVNNGRSILLKQSNSRKLISLKLLWSTDYKRRSRFNCRRRSEQRKRQSDGGTEEDERFNGGERRNKRSIIFSVVVV